MRHQSAHTSTNSLSGFCGVRPTPEDRDYKFPNCVALRALVQLFPGSWVTHILCQDSVMIAIFCSMLLLLLGLTQAQDLRIMPRDVNPSCARDNCLRAVIASYQSPAGPVRGSTDCSSFASQTYTFSTACSQTVTSTITTTTITATVATDTATVTITQFTTIAPPPVTCATTTIVTSTSVPTYASACGGPVRYASACSCNGSPGLSTSSASTLVIVSSQISTAYTTTTNTGVATTTTTVTTTATVVADPRDFPCARSARTALPPKNGVSIFTCPGYPYVFCGKPDGFTKLEMENLKCGIINPLYCDATINTSMTGIGLVEDDDKFSSRTACVTSADCSSSQFCDYLQENTCENIVPASCI